jgi:hypothetical protein
MITYTTKELKLCTEFSRVSTPENYRSMYEHLVEVARPNANENAEVWVNKMTVKTTKMWETINADQLDDSHELWLDEQLRKQYQAV